MAKVEVRKVETAALEGSTSDHTNYEYQFGGEVDGVFIPFVTKNGGYIDHLVKNGKAAQEQAKKDGTDTGTTDATTDEG